MIIDLPKNFEMIDTKGNRIVYIEQDILKISREVSFRKVMSEITYTLKGKDKCGYCKKEIEESDLTVDHMYPQEFGGPTITNNLLPSCRRCNNDKGNLNVEQYLEYLQAKNEGKGKWYKVSIGRYQEFIRTWLDFDIPKEWVTQRKISDIIIRLDAENYKSKKYNRIASYYEKYNHFQKPIIIDRKGMILDGYLAVMYARDSGIENLPVIELENVEVI